MSRQPSPVGGSHAAPRVSAKCSRCGSGYGEAEWRSLTLTERLRPNDLAQLVRDRPEALCVEVRSCKRCGRSIAARRLNEPGPAGPL